MIRNSGREQQFKRQYPILWSKLDVLCKGIYKNDLAQELYNKQNPHEFARTGNNGLQIKLGPEKIPLNVAVSKKFCDISPYYISKNVKNDFVLKNVNDNSVLPISCPQSAPSWYGETIPGMKDAVVGDLILLEGDFTAIASITKGCIYINQGEGCKFCAIGALTDDNDYERKLMDAISIMAKDKNIRNFHLTGGNDYTRGRGVSRYKPFVEQIRRYRGDVGIAVEFTPPEKELQKDFFKELYGVGADSITMNIEFWNDQTRLKYMPRKGRVSKEEYLSAFEAGLDVFGINKVASGLMVGIEPLDDTLDGIKDITSRGVIAEVYPYKSNNGSELACENSYQVTPTIDIMVASLFANECMETNGIRPDLCSGCVKCGACGITQELYRMNG